MPTRNSIKNPIEWGWAQLSDAAHIAGSAGRAVLDVQTRPYSAPPSVRRIGIGDVRAALASGLDDFGAYRADVLFLCLVYPIVGILLARAAFGYDMLPLLFPLASGFALIGPIAAVGLYEMSRRREQGTKIGWIDAFGVVRSPSFAAIFGLGLVLVAIFVLWLVVASTIYDMTLGPEPPSSIGAFIQDVLTTPAGWIMIGVGLGIGSLFAALVLAISVVSFPLLLDRDVGIETSVATSVRAVVRNPIPMGLWGLIVAAGLVLGSLPLFVGLIIVMPVLGHATWHLYRAVVAR